MQIIQPLFIFGKNNNGKYQGNASGRTHGKVISITPFLISLGYTIADFSATVIPSGMAVSGNEIERGIAFCRRGEKVRQLLQI